MKQGNDKRSCDDVAGDGVPWRLKLTITCHMVPGWQALVDTLRTGTDQVLGNSHVKSICKLNCPNKYVRNFCYR